MAKYSFLQLFIANGADKAYEVGYFKIMLVQISFMKMK